ncbi:CaiB/BaiF CoA-transferase family protein [Rhodoferax sp.]|uniref:CaiB/BaiF CoA transferase family protein n=1 Tax=Rhodoferax sp. TaxID=50421 RepID=UPI0025CD6F12|nr:CaiB/BaiF CoA-transferase family protein [Rhodoferax sp.]MCM2341444.1 CoA transferase [Rhodoferax sp.]
MTTTQAALAHLKVLDLSRVLAGPWCTQMLADLGADVIKVERPGAGDDTRHWGPPFLQDEQGNDTDQATYFTACNRNKRAITLDMAQAEGQALILKMAAQSDVLVENFKVGGLKQYGLDYESLKAVNPRLIYCSVTGFGQDGPYAERAGYDLMIQAMSGMMSITGHADGEPGGGPMRMGVALVDVLTGIYACSAILAAIEARHRTGEGQHIDMALLDVGMAVLANQAAGFLNTGKVPQRQGNTHPSLAPYQTFETLDGSMLLAVGNDGQFARFCEAAGHPEWARDGRFASNTLRVRHRDVLIPILQAVTRTRSTAQWVALLEDKAVPCGPINDIGQAFDDAQVQARGLRVDQTVTSSQPAAGTVTSIATVASPLRLTATPPVLRRPPPNLGEHTEEVLAELGLDAAQVAGLRQRGVI